MKQIREKQIPDLTGRWGGGQQLREKAIRFVVTRAEKGVKEGKSDAGGQKVQTSIYNINKYQGYMHSMKTC